MAKIKAKARDCRLIVKVKLSLKEAFNERQLQLFSGKYIRGLMKMEGAKKHAIEYSCPVGISLYDRLKKPVSRNDFFFLMEQIVDVVQKLNRNGLLVANTVFDLKNVFINERTRELQFIYLPLEEMQQKTDVTQFIESIIYSAKPMEEQDSDYIAEFVYFFKSMDRFDPDKVEKYILKEDRSAVNMIKQHGMGQSGFMTDKPADYYEHYSGREDEATGILEEEATGRLVDEEEATGLLDDGGIQEEATGLLCEQEEQVHFAVLHRLLTDEVIPIHKPVFRIGKEKSYSDYFVSSNDKVSRSHADIITRGQRYYIRDLNSKNRTFINGQPIPIQQDVEIYDGDHIRLANEEFEFHR